VSIEKSKTHAIGWTIVPCFIITLHNKDIELLKAINKFFKVGSVSNFGDKIARYRVRSREDLQIIIDHFKNYPLQTSKFISRAPHSFGMPYDLGVAPGFAYFCVIYNLMGTKEHTNVKGFLLLVSLINKLNKPLSSSTLDKLSYLGALPHVEFEAPILNKNVNLNPK
jgi:hypothetical protein